MEKVKNILEEYREGNVEIRINLFLHYRGLREEFEKIDQAMPLTPQKIKLEWPGFRPVFEQFGFKRLQKEQDL